LKGKTPTRALITNPDSNDKRDNEIRNLKVIVKELCENLNLLGTSYEAYIEKIIDYLK
jgi:hypothetical protein